MIGGKMDTVMHRQYKSYRMGSTVILTAFSWFAVTYCDDLELCLNKGGFQNNRNKTWYWSINCDIVLKICVSWRNKRCFLLTFKCWKICMSWWSERLFRCFLFNFQIWIIIEHFLITQSVYRVLIMFSSLSAFKDR